jgi:glycosyltransferase involved in cell wall biosynthesis
MDISAELPVNNLSFGNCSYNILKEFFKKNINLSLNFIGENADLSAFDKTQQDFASWLHYCAVKFQTRHSRNNPVFKLWHINGSMSSIGKEQSLLTFYELDSPTQFEINILNNQKNVLVSSNYTKTIFDLNGVNNTKYCPLGFDSENFYKTGKTYSPDQITFSLVGKLEKRKQHHKVLSAWSKKYGDNKKYALNCAIQNPFLTPEQQSGAISSILKKKFFNINFLGFMPTNSMYNDFLNSADIVIGMSAAEGWGLPEFQSVCLGKHAVILNAHAYKDWANEKNAVLVNPIGKIDSHDGVFFSNGGPFNQGKYFDWDEDEFIAACEEAEKRFINNKNNQEGEKLKEIFTWEKTTDIILDSLK